MKRCTSCGKKKALSKFNFKIKDRGIINSHCKVCSRKYVREHYIKNREYYLRKAKRRNKMVWLKVRKMIWEYLLEHPCVDCGEKDPTVLEFDHLRDKKKNISSLTNDVTLKRVLEEIAKCEVRCANCHRRKTALTLRWHKYIKMPS